ncbi:hypothetical protein F4818DRAFT_455624 [Hypoxylon cercidicola]|nr:hypothetical protein F4818DRAFT_455624 [Hypoxylon cercidicola]
MEPRSFKKLAPAPAPTNGSENPIPTSLPTPGPRKNLTRNACSPCKVKKVKCDGTRPACGRCKKSGDACLYEANRRDILKLQLLSESDTARLQNFELVFAALQNGTEHQAAELLAQIRLGESIDALASALNPSAPQPSTSASSLQSMVAISSSSTTTTDYPSSSSTAAVPQGFLDLLFNRDDWLRPTESTDGHDTQTFQKEVHTFVSDHVVEASVNMPPGSGQLSSVSRKTYESPICADPTSSCSRDGFSDGIDGVDSLNP